MYSGGAKSDPCPTRVEEEAIKRNTDCVYFLASPLTCKKGSECEYRHSEGARINPRDCRFWLTGSCLNPKCLFRHPPLDGLFGNPGATPAPTVTAYQTPQLPKGNSSAYDLSRNHVPCYYFQKGACLKGDKCPFMHGPLPAANPVTKYGSSNTSQLENSQKDSWGIRECSNQKNLSSQTISKENADKPTNVLPSTARDYTLLGNSNDKSSSQLLSHRIGFPRSHFASVPIKTSTNFPQHQDSLVQPEGQYLHGEAGEILEESSGVGLTEMRKPSDQLQSFGDRYLNGKRSEEALRETSPGFDVLVDDYLDDTDDFSRGSIQVGREVVVEDGYEQHHSGYESGVRLDRDHHRGDGEYQHLGKQHTPGDLFQHSNSSTSERVLEKPEVFERRWARRLRSSEDIDDSDLRHRLMKHRRVNDSSSTTRSQSHVEPNSGGDSNNRDRHRTHNSFRDQRRSPETATISSRLRGRITFPKSSSPEKPTGSRDVRDRGRQGVKLSTVMPSQHQGRLGGRLGLGSNENHANARKPGSQQQTVDTVDPLDFDGPRSLAELKGAKADGISFAQSTRNNDSSASLEHNGIKSSAVVPDFDASVSFEGPKPLSVLLKRKREVGSHNGEILDISNYVKETNDIEVGSTNSAAAPASQVQPGDALSKERLEEFDEPRFETVEEVNEEGLLHSEDEKITLDQQVTGVATGDAAEAYEPEDFDQRYGECDDYEAEEGGYYQREDDMDQMDVNVDENEEDDDFATKIGLIFSGSTQQGR
ncbi:hypothetical protein HPP92_014781 [Vanilla planifolia]|uniref:C3H1-type domain-containing protein n=1 Tax=Vanilla planifolia TaxID=51239 RepID=A0A835QHZ3_VANPL|nr:hypothetical protein HPP92_014781 [Vanilla planifolia]